MPARRGDAGQQQRLEKDCQRVLEAQRQELGDVLPVERVSQILEHVNVQLVAVGVREARRQAGNRGTQVSQAGAKRRDPLAGVGSECGPQNLAYAVSAGHCDAHEEAAVQIGPQHCR
jgi:hypothetical protein